MKNKIFIAIISFTLLINSAPSSFAFDLGKKIEKHVGKDIIKSDSININGIEDKILEKVNKKIDETASKIEQNINQYKEKIAAEQERVTKMIDEAEGYIQQARDLKANAKKYIRIAQIIIIVLSSGILVLLFFVWRVWRNVVNMKKAFKAVVNYDEVQKRIKALELQLSELKAAKK